jgi:hypothetical protein
MTDLGEAPADPGVPLDEGLRSLGGADRMLPEELLQRGLVLGQGALGMMPRGASQALQAPVAILVEVALRRTSGYARVVGDAVVGGAEALQPEDFHLPLDAGIGVMIAVVGQGAPVLLRESDRSHDGLPRCGLRTASRQQFIPAPPDLQSVSGQAAPSISTSARKILA